MRNEAVWRVMRLGLALVATLVVMATNARAGCIGPDCSVKGNVVDHCADRNDYDTPWMIYYPHEQCLSATGGSGTDIKRWTPRAVAEREGAVAVIGSAEYQTIDTGVPVPDLTSTCWSRNVTGGAKNGSSLAAWVNQVLDEASSRGLARPQLFRSFRFEDLVQHQFLAADPTYGIAQPDSDWVLRTDRDWATWLTFNSTNCRDGGGTCCYSHCRAPNDATVDCAFRYPVPPGAFPAGASDGGCDDIGGERPYTFATWLYGEDSAGNLEEHAVYSVFYRETTDWNGPVAVLMDLTNDDYIEWIVDLFEAEQNEITRLVTGSTANPQSIIGPEIVLKDQFFRTDAGGTHEHWSDMSDGLDGDCGTTNANVYSSGCDDTYSGPPEIPLGTNGCTDTDTTYLAAGGSTGTIAGCRWTWPYYALGMLKLGRELKSRGIPYLITAKAVDWKCAPGTTLNAANNYAAASACVSPEPKDDTSTVTSNCTADRTPHPGCTGANACILNCNEQAMYRELVANAGYVRVDTQGQSPDAAVTDAPPGTTAGGIGFNSGVTYQNVVDLIQSGVTQTWIRPINTSSSPVYRVPPILCQDPREVNPGSPVAPL